MKNFCVTSFPESWTILFSKWRRLGDEEGTINPLHSPIKSNHEGAKAQKRAILASLKLGERLSRCSSYFVQDCNLGQNKRDKLTPSPHKVILKARRSKKHAILPSLKWCEGWSRCTNIYHSDDDRMFLCYDFSRSSF